jgi:signal transduction histidine kinase
MTGRGSAWRRTATGLLVGAAAIVAVSLVIAVLKQFVNPLGLTSLYLFAILPVAIGWGFRVAGVVAVAALLTFAFFLRAPLRSLGTAESDTAASLVIALVTAYVVSELARRAHERAREAGQRAEEAEQARRALQVLVDEQEALRRVATLVARSGATSEVFEAVTREVGLRCGADLARMERFEEDHTVAALAAWSRTGETELAVGTRFALEGPSIAARVLETGRPARVDSYTGASGAIAREAEAVGIRSSVGCPIVVGRRVWGVIAASSRAAPFAPDTESRIAEFTELAATAIANAQAGEELRRIADEQAALRRVATLVARAAPPPAVFAAVAEEVGRLLAADVTGLSRFDADDAQTVVAAWSAAAGPVPTGRRTSVGDATVAELVRDTGAPARIDGYPGNRASSPIAAMLGISSSVAAPITVEGRLWGAVAAASTGGEPAPPETEDRLAGFAELVATTIANAESRAELRASRARVVATADETRRRIERDLHDGAQQRLVSLALQLRGAQAGAPAGLEELRADLDEIAAEITGLLEDLREMARGIHPAILAQGGLGPALRTLARRSPLAVAQDVRIDGRLPEQVEVGAYYVVSEALTNAAKHAHASSVVVEAAVVDGSVRVCVRDDGVGGADYASGSGLVGLKDRVEALGGRITVESTPGAGTELRAELPLRPES